MLAQPLPVSDVLGIPSSGPLPLLAAVESGLPLTALDRVTHFMAPDDGQFAFRIIPRATLARRRKALADAVNPAEARLSADEGNRLTRIASVWAMALEVWGTPEAARHFLFTPHPLLHERRPVDVVVENELGRPVVEGLLGRLQYGAAV